MRKFILLFALLLICSTGYAQISTESYTTPDDVTVARLEDNRATFQAAINSADGALITAGSITATTLDANSNPENRWNEVFDDFVFTGLLPPTSGSLSATTTAGTAYAVGTRVVKDATSNTYTANKHTYVDISNTGTFTYSEVAIDAAEPSVASNSIRLARVSTDGTTVASIVDKRVLNTVFATDQTIIGTFTRDTTLPSGTQEVTGLGIKLNSVIFFAAQGGAAEDEVSLGFDDGSNPRVVYRNDQSEWTPNATQSIWDSDDTGTNKRYKGKISAISSDGFTITWEQSSPSCSGTLTVYFMAFGS